jgi:hypothetical protein
VRALLARIPLGPRPSLAIFNAHGPIQILRRNVPRVSMAKIGVITAPLLNRGASVRAVVSGALRLFFEILLHKRYIREGLLDSIQTAVIITAAQCLL